MGTVVRALLPARAEGLRQAATEAAAVGERRLSPTLVGQKAGGQLSAKWRVRPWRQRCSLDQPAV